MGGTSPTNGNIIGGNDTGIYLLNASGNFIQGNWIGVGYNGTNALGNTNNGILINGGTDNQIGGTNAGARNVLSGNGQSGLYLNTANATRNLIQGNYLGTDVSGSLAVSNLGDGITLSGAPGNTIGPSNVISGNALSGIQMIGNTAKTNLVIGNFIGTDAAGKIALGNKFEGIYLTNALANQIGGTTAGAGNVISGNLQNGLLITGGGNSNVVQGNLIGLANGGTNALPNRYDGLIISGGTGNTIGALKGGGGNIISGNATNGVFIMLTNDGFNLLAGNYIGTDITGEKIVPNNFIGVLIQGCTNTVSRNVISGNGQQGISLSGANGSAAGNVLAGNYIGLDAAGTNGLGNGNAGVGISSAAANTIGPGNVISSNGYVGIYILGPGAGGNVIVGNYVGTDASGTAAVPNNASGIFVQAATSGTIGGTNAGDGNVISGNLIGCGILLTNSTGFFIAGNYVGLNAAGTAYLRNWDSGIQIGGATLANQIGGSTPGARNVVSGNNHYGICLIGCAAQVIQGNFIGTDVSGGFALGNISHGIYLLNSTSNLIGSAGVGNVVAGNGGSGFPEIMLNSSGNNLIQGNYVGLNAAGMTGLGPKTADGIYLTNSSGNLIGGNVVASNAVGLNFQNSSWNTNRGNYVGLAADGVTAVGNTNHNINLDSGSTNNILGGVNPGEANRIAYVQTIFAGVRVRANAFNNLISGNCIYSNGGLGIDLGNFGTNPIIHLQAGVAGNDANRLQNYPVLSNAVSGTATLVHGSFDSVPNKTYSLEFFASPSGDASGNGEGQKFLGQTNLVLGGASPTNFSVVLPTVPVGWVVTATATDATNNTSEFSNWVTTSPVPQLQPAAVYSGTNLVTRQFTLLWTNTGGSYSLLQSSHLNPPQWVATGVTSPTNGVYSFPVNATNPANFYRLLAQ
jgi:titin